MTGGPIDDANTFVLSGAHLAVTVGQGLDGSWQLTYQDPHRQESFAKDELTVEETALGRAASISLSLTPDLGSTTFTVLLPMVRVRLGESVPVTTLGVMTVRRTSIAPPLDHGQQESWTTVRLRGSATLVQT